MSTQTPNFFSKVDMLKHRHEIFSHVRNFFSTRDFIEVHTPLLVQNPGLEPHLLYFETEFIPDLGGGKKEKLYLPTSPEYHLKKALALGLPKVFEITKSFRNGEKTARHEPEFFMLEWYRHPGSLQDIANDCAALLSELGSKWAPTSPWSHVQRITVREAFRKYCHLDLDAALSGQASDLTTQARAQNFQSIQPDDDFETTFHKLVIEFIEPQLGFNGPEFLWEYPAALCALARLCPDNPLYCERFELYWRGIELANAFGELTDAQEQRRRCKADQETRLQRYGRSPELDEEFLEALTHLDQPAGGIAVGLDRLIATLLDCKQVQDVIAFPHWSGL